MTSGPAGAWPVGERGDAVSGVARGSRSFSGLARTQLCMGVEVPQLSVFPTQLPLRQISNTRWGCSTATQQCGECDRTQAGERRCLKRLLLKGLIFEEFIKNTPSCDSKAKALPSQALGIGSLTAQ